MSIIDNHHGHVISLDAVRLARGGSQGSAAACRVDVSFPLEQERASASSLAYGAGAGYPLGADVVHLSAGRDRRAAVQDRDHRSTGSVLPSFSATNLSLSSSSPTRSGPSRPGLPDLTAIAREPDYTTRRAALRQAMAFFSGGQEMSERLVDHQMMVSGMAAGHGCNDNDTTAGTTADDVWPLGSGMDDPAVVVGLVLHHVRHIGGRDMPIPEPVLRQLDRHVSLGSPAARLVRDWLNARAPRKDRQHLPERRHLQVHDGGMA